MRIQQLLCLLQGLGFLVNVEGQQMHGGLQRANRLVLCFSTACYCG